MGEMAKEYAPKVPKPTADYVRRQRELSRASSQSPSEPLAMHRYDSADAGKSARAELGYGAFRAPPVEWESPPWYKVPYECLYDGLYSGCCAWRYSCASMCCKNEDADWWGSIVEPHQTHYARFSAWYLSERPGTGLLCCKGVPCVRPLGDVTYCSPYNSCDCCATWCAYVPGVFYMTWGTKFFGDARVAYTTLPAYNGGRSFFMSNKVCIADAAYVEQLTTGPQDRGNFLGEKPMYGFLPTSDRSEASVCSFARTSCFMGDNDVIFPLSKPNGKCPMNFGHHRAFRAQFFKYIANDNALKRGSLDDPVMRRIYDDVGIREAFQETLRRSREEGWAENVLPKKGYATKKLNEAREELLVRALFYVLFGIDFGDTVPAWASWTAGKAAVLQYLAPMKMGAAHMKAMYAAMAESPALREYVADTEFPNCPSKDEFIRQVASVTIIAALVGNSHVTYFALGGGELNPLSEDRSPPADFVFPWDDREKLRLVVLENVRRNPAVYETAMKLAEPTKLPTAGGLREFPAGTPTLLSYVNANMDPNMWGDDVKEFKPYERAAMLWGPEAKLFSFNSCGDRGDRRCPGREVALQLAVNLLQECYRPTSTRTV